MNREERLQQYYDRAQSDVPDIEVEIRFVDGLLTLGDKQSTGMVTWPNGKPLIELTPCELLDGRLASEEDEEHTFAHELAHVILQHNLPFRYTAEFEDFFREIAAENMACNLLDKWHQNHEDD
jgi:Zn-dependent peptidase ImmA (M78 family)